MKRHFFRLFGRAPPLFYVNVASPFEPTPLWFGACTVLLKYVLMLIATALPGQ